jgi:hypothetical protein
MHKGQEIKQRIDDACDHYWRQNGKYPNAIILAPDCEMHFKEYINTFEFMLYAKYTNYHGARLLVTYGVSNGFIAVTFLDELLLDK